MRLEPAGFGDVSDAGAEWRWRICSPGASTIASAWAEKAFRDLPSFLIAVSIVAASHALAGRMDEARQAMLHLRELDPTLRISNLQQWLPLQRPDDLARFADGLRRAGLPE